MKQLGKLFSVVLLLVAVIACDSHPQPEPAQQPTTSSTMQFQLPERIRTSQAVNLQATGATLETSVGPVNMIRAGDRFEGSIDVASGTTLTFDLTIYEQVDNQRITYVVYRGSTNGPVTTNQTIPIFESTYTYLDDDRDGASNLAERSAGSDHANPLSTPDNPTGSAPAGVISFTDSTAQVEEGERLRINISRSGGASGVVTATVQSSEFTGLAISPTRLVWNDGDSQTKTILVQPESNPIPTDTRTVRLSLTNATGGATLGTTEIDVTILDITIVEPPPFTALATDGEWEVCVQPYNTPGPSPFATQLSGTEGRVVKCFKPCTENVILDPVSDGVAWMPVAQHSCFLSQASPGSLANAPIYTPRRERMTVNLTNQLFVNRNNIWGCDTQNRANLTYTYEVDAPALQWFQFNADGTYSHAVTTDGNPPGRLQGPETWSIEGRKLELAHINTGYRNIIFFPGNQTFHIHPDTDNRIRCTKQSF